MGAVTSILCCQGVEKCIDWMSELPMYIGIAVAIIGVAVTFFGGLSIWYTAAFLILGGVCGLGLYHTKKSHLLVNLQKKIDALKLIRDNLESTNRKLTENINSFTGENRHLKSNVQELKKDVVKFNGQLTMLEGIIATATDALGNISGASDEVKNAVTHMNEQIEESKKVATTLATFLEKEIQEGIEKINKNLAEATKQNILDVKANYEIAKRELIETKAAVRLETAQLKIEREELTKVRKQLQTTQANLENADKQLQKKIEQLNNIDQIERKAADNLSRLELINSPAVKGKISPPPGKRTDLNNHVTTPIKTS